MLMRKGRSSRATASDSNRASEGSFLLLPRVHVLLVHSGALASAAKNLLRVVVCDTRMHYNTHEILCAVERSTNGA